MHAPCILLGIVYYPDPERLIFFHKIGFFMVVVDAGQLFSCWLTIGCPLFEKFLFQNFSFFLFNGAFCWLSATVRGEGFFAHKGGCETTPWHS